MSGGVNLVVYQNNVMSIVVTTDKQVKGPVNQMSFRLRTLK